MNAEIKQKWIKALQSGEFFQTTGVLRETDNKYCCLGVLCELYARETNVGWAYDSDNGDYDFLHHRASLPDDVLYWAGLEDEFGWSGVRENGSRFNLAHLNDGGTTFPEIAEVIEKNL